MLSIGLSPAIVVVVILVALLFALISTLSIKASDRNDNTPVKWG